MLYNNIDFITPEKAEDILSKIINTAKEIKLSEFGEEIRKPLTGTLELLKNYSIYSPEEVPAYYPIEPLKDYLEYLNTNLEYTWRNEEGEITNWYGRYGKVWIYKSDNSGNLIPEEVDMSDLYESHLRLFTNITSGYELLRLGGI